MNSSDEGVFKFARPHHGCSRGRRTTTFLWSWTASFKCRCQIMPFSPALGPFALDVSPLIYSFSCRPANGDNGVFHNRGCLLTTSALQYPQCPPCDRAIRCDSASGFCSEENCSEMFYLLGVVNITFINLIIRPCGRVRI